ncbi:MAG TPA: hypothetical protein VHW44_05215 [Pseudonocardiaceae bacterium]|nr:hypothetical protein [Pseudonocardiaceae bacterium]
MAGRSTANGPSMAAAQRMQKIVPGSEQPAQRIGSIRSTRAARALHHNDVVARGGLISELVGRGCG